MATHLESLVVKEVSLVDRGANPGADIVFFKRAEPGSIAKTDNPTWPVNPSPEVIRNAMKALGAVVMSASADPLEKSLPVVMKAMREFLDYVVPGAEVVKLATDAKQPRHPPAIDEDAAAPLADDDPEASAEMEKVLDRMVKADPKLSRAAALAKVAESREHAPLWKRFKLGSLVPRKRTPDLTAATSAMPKTVGMTTLQGIADKIREANPKLSPAQAFARAIDTKEGMQAYREHKAETISAKG